MTETKERYLIFDTDKPELANGLTLNKTTMRHGKAVARACAFNSSLTDQARAQWMKKAGLHREDPDGELPDAYDVYTASAALAQALFAGCPKLIDEQGQILDEELFECLDQGEVNRGFLDFEQRRNGMKSGLLNLLNS